MHVVICGKVKNVEEDLAELIFLEFGLRVDPTKPEIDNVLNKRGINLYDFIRNASKRNLRGALTDLTAAFESMETTYRRNTV
jgi:hypothetical protein